MGTTSVSPFLVSTVACRQRTSLIVPVCSAKRILSPGSIDRYLNLDGAPVFSLDSYATLAEGAERAAALGFTDVVVHWPRADGIYAGSEAVLEEMATRLPELRGVVLPAN